LMKGFSLIPVSEGPRREFKITWGVRAGYGPSGRLALAAGIPEGVDRRTDPDIDETADHGAEIGDSSRVPVRCVTRRWRRESRANPSPKMGLFRTILDGKKLVLVLKIAKNRHP